MDPVDARSEAKTLMLKVISTKMIRMPINKSQVALPDLPMSRGMTVPKVAVGPMVPIVWATFSRPDR